MPKKASKDKPLSEITLRKYEKPGQLRRRELVKRLCLSLGVLHPGDSRDVIVDILDVLIEASKKTSKLTSFEVQRRVIDSRKKNSLSQIGTAHSNISRQLRRLREIMLVEKNAGRYRITEFASLREVTEEKIMKYLIASLSERIYDYCDAIDNFK